MTSLLVPRRFVTLRESPMISMTSPGNAHTSIECSRCVRCLPAWWTSWGLLGSERRICTRKC